MEKAHKLIAAAVLPLCLLFATACGRYADFTLPALSPGRVPDHFAFEDQPAPVIARGAPGDWDSRDVLNPSVVKKDGVYFNFYSGFDGKTWHTGVAISEDGLTWRKQGRALTPAADRWEGGYIAANGSALLVDGEFFYWYQAGEKAQPRIGLARSTDGRQWRKADAPVLATGPRGSWDECGVADPCVIRLNGEFYMFYLGQDRARRQRLGVARSGDGLRWEKLRSNPVLELGETGSFDENGLGEPAVWTAHGYYWMLYTGRDRAEHRRLGLARSKDGVSWRKLPGAFAGNAAWNDKVVCDPSVEPAGDTVRVWFGGGDAASPDENLNGQIGFGILRPVNATLTK